MEKLSSFLVTYVNWDQKGFITMGTGYSLAKADSTLHHICPVCWPWSIAVFYLHSARCPIYI